MSFESPTKKSRSTIARPTTEIALVDLAPHEATARALDQCEQDVAPVER